MQILVGNKNSLKHIMTVYDDLMTYLAEVKILYPFQNITTTLSDSLTRREYNILST